MDSPFMAFFAQGLAARGYRVCRFEFPHMAERRRSGRRRPPDSARVLLDAWRAVIAALGPQRLVIGGKSLGGRIASMLADEAGVLGLVCLGYPFHPPGKPDRPRIDHLRALATPTLILQGSRDPFGRPEEVAAYPLSPAIRIEWLADGDHGFKPGKASARSAEQNRRQAMEALASFLAALS